MIRNITYGTDPEFFIANKRLGLIISSIPLVSGTKEYPESLGDGFFILADNILVEGNVPPVKTPAEFTRTMSELRKRISSYLFAKFPEFADDFELVSSDCKTVEARFLTHPDALQFGCSPYLNAWDGQVHKAKDMSSVLERTAGFHIHIGYEKEPGSHAYPVKAVNAAIVKAFDLFVTIPSYAEHFDKTRFLNYGGLGQYRDTSYGVECRSLGGRFTDEKYVPWVIHQTEKVVKFIQSETNLRNLMGLECPRYSVVNNQFTFDASVYEELDLSYTQQLFTETIKSYAANN